MKVGMLFSGLGDQSVGMAKDIYDEYRIMQEYFEDAGQCLDKNFVKICFASSVNELADLENSFISLYLIGVSTAAILKEQGIAPAVVAGYENGEYAALSSVGSLALFDAVYLLRKLAGLYSEMLQAKAYKTIRIYGLDYDAVKKLCLHCSNGNQISHIASIEDDTTHSVAGTVVSIDYMEAELKKDSVRYESVATMVGLHSPLMDEILKSLKMYLEKVDFHAVSAPFVAGVTGQALVDGEAVRAAIMQQIHAPLQWKKVIDAFEYCDVIIIIGPSSWLFEMVSVRYPGKKIFMIAYLKQLEECIAYCKGTVVQ